MKCYPVVLMYFDFHFFSTQWTRDRMNEGIGRWTSMRGNKISFVVNPWWGNKVMEDNNLVERGVFYAFAPITNQHTPGWNMAFNRLKMQADEANGWPRWLTISTFAHEIGHMVGLDHITSNPANLMYIPWYYRTVSYPGTGDLRGFDIIWP